MQSAALRVGRWLWALPQRGLMALVRAYRLLLSPWLGNACRFEPTCSVYSLGALQAHGALLGSYLTVRRLARCHPWCPGGHDPVPALVGGLFTRLNSTTVSNQVLAETEPGSGMPEVPPLTLSPKKTRS